MLNFLQGVSFGVFGLGNKQYEHFNAVGKKVHKAMQTLGGKAVVRRGDGDDDGCIDDDFDKWVGELQAALDESDDLVGKKLDQNGAAATIDVPSYTVEVLDKSIKLAQPFAGKGTGKDHHSPYWATVSTVRELHTSESDRSCVHVEIDIAGSGIKYEHGDHVAIYAQNSPAVVEEVAQLLGQPLDLVFSLKVPSGSNGELMAMLDKHAMSDW